MKHLLSAAPALLKLPRYGLLLVLAAAGTEGAHAQNLSTNATAALLPFSQLMGTPAGQSALAENLATALAVQNSATTDLQLLAIHDYTIDGNRATSLANGLGTEFQAAYFYAIYSNSSLIGSHTSHLYQLFTHANNATGDAAGFAKSFYGSGEGAGSGISFPSGGQPDVYGLAYVPAGDTNPNSGGDPRPFQVAPLQTPPGNIVIFSGPSFVAPSPEGSSPVGANTTNADANATLTSSPAFPSGHTTYGYTSSILFAMMQPENFQRMMARASEYGNSRIVMGAHYPLDVMGGRTIATYTLAQWLQDADHQALLTAAAGDLATLLDEFGGSPPVVEPASWVPAYDYDTARADYLFRMTYGLPPTGPTDLAPIVPDGAEVLLATRFPYLTVEQRREVLRTTQIPSGAALNNVSPGYEGWFRLNLFDAAGGYGAIVADTTVAMDAAQGGLSAADTWNNNIGGGGVLTKAGTGNLTLSGDNDFGGVNVQRGMLSLTGTNTYSGASSVGGGSGAATLSVSGNMSSASVTVSASGKLVVAPGGRVDAGGDIHVQPGGAVNVYVTSSALLNAGTGSGGSFINDGAVNFIIGPEQPAGSYTPITTGGGAITGSNFSAYGGTWDGGTHTLTVEAINEVPVNVMTDSGSISGVDIAGSRLGFDFSVVGGHDLVLSFGETLGPVACTAQQSFIGEINGQYVLTAYNFDATFTSEFAVLFSNLGAPIAPDQIAVWYLPDDATEWQLFTPEEYYYENGWYGFQTEGFSSYAITTVPESATAPLLSAAVAGVGVLLVRRRRANTTAASASTPQSAAV